MGFGDGLVSVLVDVFVLDQLPQPLRESVVAGNRHNWRRLANFFATSRVMASMVRDLGKTMPGSCIEIIFPPDVDLTFSEQTGRDEEWHT